MTSLTYSADGKKLKAVYAANTISPLDATTPINSWSNPASESVNSTGGSIAPILTGNKTVEYVGNLIYENGVLKQMLVEGGYVSFGTNNAPTYHFYIQDHLGNNRVVVSQSGTVEQVNHYYPYGGLMSNSTGWNTQRFKYNGKEFDRMHGLDWYDYGARWMDASIGRWHSIDPLCEKYYNVSPYVYCAGNPVRFIDPDGKEVRDGTGAYCEDNKDAKQLAKTLAAHNDPNSIMIVAHGIYENENSRFATSIDIQTYNPSTKEWNHNVISDGKQLDSFLSANSKTWNRYKNGKINAEDLHIVFYSCGSCEVVKEISKDEAFKDVTFIAPNKKVQHLKNTDGSWQTSVENTKWEKREDNYQYPVGGVRDFGYWQT